MVGPADGGVGRWWELPFAGREAELRDFDADLSAAEARRCRMLVVSGAHGEGKSRLLDEFAAVARARQFTVVSARGVDETGSPPMWCWRHLITDLVNGLDPLSRASVVGAHGPALVGLLDVGALEIGRHRPREWLGGVPPDGSDLADVAGRRASRSSPRDGGRRPVDRRLVVAHA